MDFQLRFEFLMLRFMLGSELCDFDEILASYGKE
jgi:hypothetical protein